jgi:hypothetical protein
MEHLSRHDAPAPAVQFNDEVLRLQPRHRLPGSIDHLDINRDERGRRPEDRALVGLKAGHTCTSQHDAGNDGGRRERAA